MVYACSDCSSLAKVSRASTLALARRVSRRPNFPSGKDASDSKRRENIFFEIRTLTRRPRPESGFDCLIYKKIARQRSVLVSEDPVHHFWTCLDLFREVSPLLPHTHAFTKQRIGVCWSRKPTAESGCNPSMFNTGGCSPIHFDREAHAVQHTFFSFFTLLTGPRGSLRHKRSGARI